MVLFFVVEEVEEEVGDERREKVEKIPQVGDKVKLWQERGGKMYNPREIANEVEEERRKGASLREAVKMVASKHQLREYDVEVAAVIWLEDLWELWKPNRRR
ncbi:MAG: hypothetical protein DRJ64_03655 [Thermoprotei archaeon]|nr:MAG: hypothetical protein DRJ64_03655 [Thermoprotei archaeon]